MKDIAIDDYPSEDEDDEQLYLLYEGDDGCWFDDDDDDDDDYNDNYYVEDAINQPSYEIGTILYAGNLEIAKILKQINMICLASSYMLIADIDCGNEVDKSLNHLKQFLKTNEGNFRVYRTKNGMRYIQTDCLYQGANQSAIKVLNTYLYVKKAVSSWLD